MAIAGWLLIGVALLIFVAVLNNSWRPLLDQFRGLNAPANVTTPDQALIDIHDAAPAESSAPSDQEPEAPAAAPPADVVQPGAPPANVATA